MFYADDYAYNKKGGYNESGGRDDKQLDQPRESIRHDEYRESKSVEEEADDYSYRSRSRSAGMGMFFKSASPKSGETLLSHPDPTDELATNLPVVDQSHAVSYDNKVYAKGESPRIFKAENSLPTPSSMSTSSGNANYSHSISSPPPLKPTILERVTKENLRARVQPGGPTVLDAIGDKKAKYSSERSKKKSQKIPEPAQSLTSVKNSTVNETNQRYEKSNPSRKAKEYSSNRAKSEPRRKQNSPPEISFSGESRNRTIRGPSRAVSKEEETPLSGLSSRPNSRTGTYNSPEHKSERKPLPSSSSHKKMRKSKSPLHRESKAEDEIGKQGRTKSLSVYVMGKDIESQKKNDNPKSFTSSSPSSPKLKQTSSNEAIQKSPLINKSKSPQIPLTYDERYMLPSTYSSKENLLRTPHKASSHNSHGQRQQENVKSVKQSNMSIEEIKQHSTGNLIECSLGDRTEISKRFPPNKKRPSKKSPVSSPQNETHRKRNLSKEKKGNRGSIKEMSNSQVPEGSTDANLETGTKTDHKSESPKSTSSNADKKTGQTSAELTNPNDTLNSPSIKSSYKETQHDTNMNKGHSISIAQDVTESTLITDIPMEGNDTKKIVSKSTPPEAKEVSNNKRDLPENVEILNTVKTPSGKKDRNVHLDKKKGNAIVRAEDIESQGNLLAELAIGGEDDKASKYIEGEGRCGHSDNQRSVDLTDTGDSTVNVTDSGKKLKEDIVKPLAHKLIDVIVPNQHGDESADKRSSRRPAPIRKARDILAQQKRGFSPNDHSPKSDDRVAAEFSSKPNHRHTPSRSQRVEKETKVEAKPKPRESSPLHRPASRASVVVETKRSHKEPVTTISVTSKYKIQPLPSVDQKGQSDVVSPSTAHRKRKISFSTKSEFVSPEVSHHSSSRSREPKCSMLSPEMSERRVKRAAAAKSREDSPAEPKKLNMETAPSNHSNHGKKAKTATKAQQNKGSHETEGGMSSSPFVDTLIASRMSDNSHPPTVTTENQKKKPSSPKQQRAHDNTDQNIKTPPKTSPKKSPKVQGEGVDNTQNRASSSNTTNEQEIAMTKCPGSPRKVKCKKDTQRPSSSKEEKSEEARPKKQPHSKAPADDASPCSPGSPCRPLRCRSTDSIETSSLPSSAPYSIRVKASPKQEVPTKEEVPVPDRPCGKCIPSYSRQCTPNRKSKSGSSISRGSGKNKSGKKKRRACKGLRRDGSAGRTVDKCPNAQNQSAGIFSAISKAIGCQLQHLAFNKTRFHYPSRTGFYHLDNSIIGWVGHSYLHGSDSFPTTSTASSGSSEDRKEKRPEKPPFHTDSEDTFKDHASFMSNDEGSKMSKTGTDHHPSSSRKEPRDGPSSGQGSGSKQRHTYYSNDPIDTSYDTGKNYLSLGTRDEVEEFQTTEICDEDVVTHTEEFSDQSHPASKSTLSVPLGASEAKLIPPIRPSEAHKLTPSETTATTANVSPRPSIRFSKDSILSTGLMSTRTASKSIPRASPRLPESQSRYSSRDRIPSSKDDLESVISDSQESSKYSTSFVPDGRRVTEHLSHDPSASSLIHIKTISKGSTATASVLREQPREYDELLDDTQDTSRKTSKSSVRYAQDSRKSTVSQSHQSSRGSTPSTQDAPKSSSESSKSIPKERGSTMSYKTGSQGTSSFTVPATVGESRMSTLRQEHDTSHETSQISEDVYPSSRPRPSGTSKSSVRSSQDFGETTTSSSTVPISHMASSRSHEYSRSTDKYGRESDKSLMTSSRRSTKSHAPEELESERSPVSSSRRSTRSHAPEEIESERSLVSSSRRSTRSHAPEELESERSPVSSSRRSTRSHAPEEHESDRSPVSSSRRSTRSHAPEELESERSLVSSSRRSTRLHALEERESDRSPVPCSRRSTRSHATEERESDRSQVSSSRQSTRLHTLEEHESDRSPVPSSCRSTKSHATEERESERSQVWSSCQRTRSHTPEEHEPDRSPVSSSRRITRSHAPEELESDRSPVTSSRGSSRSFAQQIGDSVRSPVSTSRMCSRSVAQQKRESDRSTVSSGRASSRSLSQEPRELERSRIPSSHLGSRSIGEQVRESDMSQVSSSHVSFRSLAQDERESDRSLVPSSRVLSRSTLQQGDSDRSLVPSSHVSFKSIGEQVYESDRSPVKFSHVSSKSIEEHVRESGMSAVRPSHMSSRSIGEQVRESDMSPVRPSHMSSRSIGEQVRESDMSPVRPSHMSSRSIGEQVRESDMSPVRPSHMSSRSFGEQVRESDMSPVRPSHMSSRSIGEQVCESDMSPVRPTHMSSRSIGEQVRESDMSPVRPTHMSSRSIGEQVCESDMSPVRPTHMSSRSIGEQVRESDMSPVRPSHMISRSIGEQVRESDRSPVRPSHMSSRSFGEQVRESDITAVPGPHVSSRATMQQVREFDRSLVSFSHVSPRSCAEEVYESYRSPLPFSHERSRSTGQHLRDSHRSTEPIPQSLTRSTVQQVRESTRPVVPCAHVSFEATVHQGHESARSPMPSSHVTRRSTVHQSHELPRSPVPCSPVSSRPKNQHVCEPPRILEPCPCEDLKIKAQQVCEPPRSPVPCPCEDLRTKAQKLCEPPRSLVPCPCECLSDKAPEVCEPTRSPVPPCECSFKSTRQSLGEQVLSPEPSPYTRPFSTVHFVPEPHLSQVPYTHESSGSTVQQYDSLKSTRQSLGEQVLSPETSPQMKPLSTIHYVHGPSLSTVPYTHESYRSTVQHASEPPLPQVPCTHDTFGSTVHQVPEPRLSPDPSHQVSSRSTIHRLKESHLSPEQSTHVSAMSTVHHAQGPNVSLVPTSHVSSRPSVPEQVYHFESPTSQVPTPHVTSRSTVEQARESNRSTWPSSYVSSETTVEQLHESGRSAMPSSQVTSRYTVEELRESNRTTVPSPQVKSRSTVEQVRESNRTTVPSPQVKSRSTVEQVRESNRTTVPCSQVTSRYTVEEVRESNRTTVPSPQVISRSTVEQVRESNRTTVPSSHVSSRSTVEQVRESERLTMPSSHESSRSSIEQIRESDRSTMPSSHVSSWSTVEQVRESDRSTVPSSHVSSRSTVEQVRESERLTMPSSHVSSRSTIEQIRESERLTMPSSHVSSRSTIEQVRESDRSTMPSSHVSSWSTIEQVRESERLTMPSSHVSSRSTIEQIRESDRSTVPSSHVSSRSTVEQVWGPPGPPEPSYHASSRSNMEQARETTRSLVTSPDEKSTMPNASESVGSPGPPSREISKSSVQPVRESGRSHLQPSEEDIRTNVTQPRMTSRYGNETPRSCMSPTREGSRATEPLQSILKSRLPSVFIQEKNRSPLVSGEETLGSTLLQSQEPSEVEKFPYSLYTFDTMANTTRETSSPTLPLDSETQMATLTFPSRESFNVIVSRQDDVTSSKISQYKVKEKHTAADYFDKTQVAPRSDTTDSPVSPVNDRIDAVETEESGASCIELTQGTSESPGKSRRGSPKLTIRISSPDSMRGLKTMLIINQNETQGNESPVPGQASIEQRRCQGRVLSVDDCLPKRDKVGLSRGKNDDACLEYRRKSHLQRTCKDVSPSEFTTSSQMTGETSLSPYMSLDSANENWPDCRDLARGRSTGRRGECPCTSTAKSRDPCQGLHRRDYRSSGSKHYPKERAQGLSSMDALHKGRKSYSHDPEEFDKPWNRGEKTWKLRHGSHVRGNRYETATQDICSQRRRKRFVSSSCEDISTPYPSHGSRSHPGRDWEKESGTTSEETLVGRPFVSKRDTKAQSRGTSPSSGLIRLSSADGRLYVDHSTSTQMPLDSRVSRESEKKNRRTDDKSFARPNWERKSSQQSYTSNDRLSLRRDRKDNSTMSSRPSALQAKENSSHEESPPWSRDVSQAEQDTRPERDIKSFQSQSVQSSDFQSTLVQSQEKEKRGTDKSRLPEVSITNNESLADKKSIGESSNILYQRLSSDNEVPKSKGEGKDNNAEGKSSSRRATDAQLPKKDPQWPNNEDDQNVITSLSDTDTLSRETKSSVPVKRSESDCSIRARELDQVRRKNFKGRIVIRRSKIPDTARRSGGQNVAIRNLNVRLVCTRDGKKHYVIDENAVPRDDALSRRQTRDLLQRRSTPPEPLSSRPQSYKKRVDTDGQSSPSKQRFQSRISHRAMGSPTRRSMHRRSISSKPVFVNPVRYSTLMYPSSIQRSRSNSARRTIDSASSFSESIDVFNRIITPEQPTPVGRHTTDLSPTVGYLDDIEYPEERRGSNSHQAFDNRKFLMVPNQSTGQNFRPGQAPFFHSSPNDTSQFLRGRGSTLRRPYDTDAFGFGFDDESTDFSTSSTTKMQIWSENKNASSSGGQWISPLLDFKVLKLDRPSTITVRHAVHPEKVLSKTSSHKFINSESPANESISWNSPHVSEPDTGSPIKKTKSFSSVAQSNVAIKTSEGSDQNLLARMNISKLTKLFSFSMPFTSTPEKESRPTKRLVRSDIFGQSTTLKDRFSSVDACAFLPEIIVTPSKGSGDFTNIGDTEHGNRSENCGRNHDSTRSCQTSTKREWDIMKECDAYPDHQESKHSSRDHLLDELCTNLVDDGYQPNSDPCHAPPKVEPFVASPSENDTGLLQADSSAANFTAKMEISSPARCIKNEYSPCQSVNGELHVESAAQTSCSQESGGLIKMSTLDDNLNKFVGTGIYYGAANHAGLEPRVTCDVYEPSALIPMESTHISDFHRSPLYNATASTYNDPEKEIQRYGSENEHETKSDNKINCLVSHELQVHDPSPHICSNKTNSKGTEGFGSPEQFESTDEEVTELQSTSHDISNVLEQDGDGRWSPMPIESDFCLHNRPPLNEDGDSTNETKNNTAPSSDADVKTSPESKLVPRFRTVAMSNSLSTEDGSQQPQVVQDVLPRNSPYGKAANLHCHRHTCPGTERVFAQHACQSNWISKDDTGNHEGHDVTKETSLEAGACKGNEYNSHSSCAGFSKIFSANDRILETSPPLGRMDTCRETRPMASDSSIFKLVTGTLGAEMRSLGSRLRSPFMSSPYPYPGKSTFRGSSVDFSYVHLGDEDMATSRKPTIRFAQSGTDSKAENDTDQMETIGTKSERRHHRRRKRLLTKSHRIAKHRGDEMEDWSRGVLGHVLLRNRFRFGRSSLGENKVFKRCERSMITSRYKYRIIKPKVKRGKAKRNKTGHTLKETRGDDIHEKALTDDFRSCGLSQLGRKLNRAPLNISTRFFVCNTDVQHIRQCVSDNDLQHKDQDVHDNVLQSKEQNVCVRDAQLTEQDVHSQNNLSSSDYQSYIAPTTNRFEPINELHDVQDQLSPIIEESCTESTDSDIRSPEATERRRVREYSDTDAVSFVNTKSAPKTSYSYTGIKTFSSASHPDTNLLSEELHSGTEVKENEGTDDTNESDQDYQLKSQSHVYSDYSQESVRKPSGSTFQNNSYRSSFASYPTAEVNDMSSVRSQKYDRYLKTNRYSRSYTRSWLTPEKGHRYVANPLLKNNNVADCDYMTGHGYSSRIKSYLDSETNVTSNFRLHDTYVPYAKSRRNEDERDSISGCYSGYQSNYLRNYQLTPPSRQRQNSDYGWLYSTPTDQQRVPYDSPRTQRKWNSLPSSSCRWRNADNWNENANSNSSPDRGGFSENNQSDDQCSPEDSMTGVDASTPGSQLSGAADGHISHDVRNGISDFSLPLYYGTSILLAEELPDLDNASVTSEFIADFAHQNVNSSGNIFDRAATSETKICTRAVQTQVPKEESSHCHAAGEDGEQTPYIQHLSFVNGLEACEVGSWVEDLCNHRLYSHARDSFAESEKNPKNCPHRCNNILCHNPCCVEQVCHLSKLHQRHLPNGLHTNSKMGICASNNWSDQDDPKRGRRPFFIPFMKNGSRHQHHSQQNQHQRHQPQHLYKCFPTDKTRGQGDIFSMNRAAPTKWYVEDALTEFNADPRLIGQNGTSKAISEAVCAWSGGECTCESDRLLRGSEGLGSDYGSEEESEGGSDEGEYDSNPDLAIEEEHYSECDYDEVEDEDADEAIYKEKRTSEEEEAVYEEPRVAALGENSKLQAKGDMEKSHAPPAYECTKLNTTQNKNTFRKQGKDILKEIYNCEQDKDTFRPSNHAVEGKRRGGGGRGKRDLYLDQSWNLSPRKPVSMEDIRVQNVAKERVRFACDENGDWAEIGRGSYGCVYLGLLDGVVEVAIKDFYESNSYDQVIHEARMLAFLQNTGITPKFYGLRKRFDATKQPGEFCIIMEYFGEGKTLFNVLSEKIELAYDEWLDVLGQLVAGLRLIHRRNVLLNDLKADNILIDLCGGRKSIRYIDVGMATYKHGLTFQLPQEQMGKYNFLAPEVRDGAHTSRKSDIYSLGYMLDQMTKLAGPALHGLNEVVQSCLDVNPKRRPSVDQIVDHVHRFIVAKTRSKVVKPRVALSSSA